MYGYSVVVYYVASNGERIREDIAQFVMSDDAEKYAQWLAGDIVNQSPTHDVAWVFVTAKGGSLWWSSNEIQLREVSNVEV